MLVKNRAQEQKWKEAVYLGEFLIGCRSEEVMQSVSPTNSSDAAPSMQPDHEVLEQYPVLGASDLASNTHKQLLQHFWPKQLGMRRYLPLDFAQLRICGLARAQGVHGRHHLDKTQKCSVTQQAYIMSLCKTSSNAEQRGSWQQTYCIAVLSSNRYICTQIRPIVSNSQQHMQRPACEGVDLAVPGHDRRCAATQQAQQRLPHSAQHARCQAAFACCVLLPDARHTLLLPLVVPNTPPLLFLPGKQ